MKLLTISLFFLINISSFAQQDAYLLEKNDVEKEKYLIYLKQSFDDLANKVLPNHSGEIKKQLKESFTSINKELETEIQDNQFIFDKRFLGFANEILDELKLKNNEIPKNLKILISKETVLNAYCLPNGSLVLNTGLFYWLENEEQLASIIAHEVAHEVLNHGIKSQVKYVQDNYSKTNKQIVKNISKNEVKKVHFAFKLFQSQLYANAKIKQKHEFEADSLSYLFIKNSKYDSSQITSSMRLSIKYDSITPKGLDKKIYKEVFNLPDQPFQEKWLKMEDFSQYNYDLFIEKIDKDSVTTHPEMDERIAKLEKNFPDLKENFTKQASAEFLKLEKLAQMNLVSNLTDMENYGYAIYVCLLNIQNQIEVEHHKYWLGKNFELVHEARKNYSLNRYLDRINPKNQSESYQQFLNFMWNLNLNEFSKIATYYKKETKN